MKPWGASRASRRLETELSVALFLIAALAWGAPSPTPTPCASNLTNCHGDECKASKNHPVDPVLNALKNKTAAASSPEHWTVGKVIGLNAKTPDSWKKSDPRDDLEQIGEGKHVIVKGYLIDAVKERGESCNCNLTGDDEVDFHLWLSSRKPPDAMTKDELKDRKKKSIVVEITPRIRAAKNGWDWDKVKAIKKDHDYVRATGYLLLDTLHRNIDNMARATAWEVHPITQLEVCTGTKTSCDGGSDWEALASFSPP